MLKRYRYRLHPTPGQRHSLARAFGCARAVYNDSIAAREQAYAAGQGWLSDAVMARRLTEAKQTPERAWLNEVSSVVLQQAQREANRAYRSFFEGLVPHQATFALSTTARSRRSRAWRFRQAM